jgi:hypothetical protein
LGEGLSATNDFAGTGILQNPEESGITGIPVKNSCKIRKKPDFL